MTITKPGGCRKPRKRFDRFEIQEGYIVPAEGAALIEDEPWRDFDSNLGKYRSVKQPYLPFLRLSRQIQVRQAKGGTWSHPRFHLKQIPIPVQNRGPQTDIDRLVLAWCNEHGHLGLLPIRGTWIRPANRSTESGTETAVLHTRTGGKWHSVTSNVPNPRGWPKEGSFSQYSWYDGVTKESPIADIEKYLPALQMGDISFEDIPSPDDPAFLPIYSEIVTDVIDAAQDFLTSVTTISKWDHKSDKPPDYQQSKLFLESLAQAEDQTFEEGPENTYVEVWNSAGLLASYARMVRADFCMGRRVLQCSRCDDLFVSNEFSAAYCSTRCRNQARSRRSYERNKDRAQSKAVVSTEDSKTEVV